MILCQWERCAKPLPVRIDGAPGRNKKFCDARCKMAYFNARRPKRGPAA